MLRGGGEGGILSLRDTYGDMCESLNRIVEGEAEIVLTLTRSLPLRGGNVPLGSSEGTKIREIIGDY